MLALGVCFRPARALAACVPRQHVCRVKISFPMVLEPKYLEKCIVQLKAKIQTISCADLSKKFTCSALTGGKVVRLNQFSSAY